jgi:hypothetical protein
LTRTYQERRMHGFYQTCVIGTSHMPELIVISLLRPALYLNSGGGL